MIRLAQMIYAPIQRRSDKAGIQGAELIMKTRIRRLMSGVVLAICGLSASVAALADYWLYVPDASQLTYVVYPDAHVYLRNLNQFDATVLGCCFTGSI